MKRKFLSAAFALALAMSMGSAWGAADHDIDGTDVSGVVVATGDAIISATGVDNTASSAATWTLVTGAVQLGKGAVTPADGKGFTLNLGTLQAAGAGTSTLNIVTANANAAGNKAVKLNVTNVDLTAVGHLAIDIGASASKTDFNSVTIGTLGAANNAANLDLTVRENSKLTITSVMGGELGATGGGGGMFNLDLVKADAEILEGVTLVNGSIGVISAPAGSTANLAIGGAGLTVDGAAAFLRADNGTLNVLTALGSDTFADVTVGGTGGNLQILNNSTLNVGNLTVETGAVFSGGLPAGTLNVNGNLAVKDDFTDAAGVATKVKGTTDIATGATYQVAGTNNVYAGKMTIEGTLSNDNAATIKTGTYDAANKLLTRGEIEIVDGSIVADATGALKIDNADILVSSVTANPVLDASAAKLDLATSNLKVDIDPTGTAMTIDATAGVDLNSYAQLNGNVEQTAGIVTVNEASSIGSATASERVEYKLTAASNAIFKKGLTLENYGALSTDATNGTVTLGEANKPVNLTMKDNTLLLGDAGGTLTIADASTKGSKIVVDGYDAQIMGTVNAANFAIEIKQGKDLRVAGAGLTVKGMDIYGSLDLGDEDYLGTGVAAGAAINTTADIRVQKGGFVAANVDSVITNTGPNTNKFHVLDGANLMADYGNITLTGFKSVEIDGIYTAGLDAAGSPTTAKILSANSDINIGSSGVVALNADLASVATAGTQTAPNVVDGTVIMTATGTGKINTVKELSNTSMLGTFGFSLTDNQQTLYVSSVDNQVKLDGTEADRQQALWNLQGMWGKNQIESDFGQIVYDVVKGDVISVPVDSIAGNKNLDIFNAIATPAGKRVGLDTVEFMNGSFLYGATDVNMEINRTFMSDITNRTKALNQQFVASRNVSSSDAMATTALNSNLNNRIWFGGTGLWQNSNKKDGFSGYEYKGYGFVGGFDSVIGSNVALGAAFSYNKGDYEDKGALAHDSDIENFSGGLYATVSSCSGFFGTLYGAYTYGDNDLRELRNDPSAGTAAWAGNKYHTNTWSVGTVLGVDIRPTECLTITPSVGFNYIQAKNSDHDASLNGVNLYRVKNAKNRGMFLPVEVTAQYDIHLGEQGKVRLEANAGYAYNFKKNGLNGSIDYYDLAPASSVNIHGRDNARHSWKVGGAARFQYRNFEMAVKYDYQGRSDYNAHRVMGTIGLDF